MGRLIRLKRLSLNLWETKITLVFYASSSINTFTVKSIILLEEIFLEKLFLNMFWHLLLSAVQLIASCLSGVFI